MTQLVIIWCNSCQNLTPLTDICCEKFGENIELLNDVIKDGHCWPIKQQYSQIQQLGLIIQTCQFGSKVGQFHPKWDKSGTFFKSDFSTFWRPVPKCTEI